MVNLEFVVTQSCPFPNAWFTGGSVGMTVCRLEGALGQSTDPRRGDPALAILPQTPDSDDIIYLGLDLSQQDNEIGRFEIPAPDTRISGFGYNPITKDIWALQNEQDWTSPADVSTTHRIIAFDPGTMVESFRNDFATTMAFRDYEGLATNGLSMAMTQGDTVELRTLNGAPIGSREYAAQPDQFGIPQRRKITGISAAPWSWIFSDRQDHELVVINLIGNVIGTAPLPGANGTGPTDGVMAIAYDYVNYPYRIARDFDGVAPPGQVPPDWPWAPTPWIEAHRIYVANATDETIYAGYLSPAP